MLELQVIIQDHKTNMLLSKYFTDHGGVCIIFCILTNIDGLVGVQVPNQDFQIGQFWEG